MQAALDTRVRVLILSQFQRTLTSVRDTETVAHQHATAGNLLRTSLSCCNRVAGEYDVECTLRTVSNAVAALEEVHRTCNSAVAKHSVAVLQRVLDNTSMDKRHPLCEVVAALPHPDVSAKPRVSAAKPFTPNVRIGAPGTDDAAESSGAFYTYVFYTLSAFVLFHYYRAVVEDSHNLKTYFSDWTRWISGRAFDLASLLGFTHGAYEPPTTTPKIPDEYKAHDLDVLGLRAYRAYKQDLPPGVSRFGCDNETAQDDDPCDQTQYTNGAFHAVSADLQWLIDRANDYDIDRPGLPPATTESTGPLTLPGRGTQQEAARKILHAMYAIASPDVDTLSTNSQFYFTHALAKNVKRKFMRKTWPFRGGYAVSDYKWQVTHAGPLSEEQAQQSLPQQQRENTTRRSSSDIEWTARPYYARAGRSANPFKDKKGAFVVDPPMIWAPFGTRFMQAVYFGNGAETCIRRNVMAHAGTRMTMPLFIGVAREAINYLVGAPQKMVGAYGAGTDQSFSEILKRVGQPVLTLVLSWYKETEYSDDVDGGRIADNIKVDMANNMEDNFRRVFTAMPEAWEFTLDLFLPGGAATDISERYITFEDVERAFPEYAIGVAGAVGARFAPTQKDFDAYAQERKGFSKKVLDAAGLKAMCEDNSPYLGPGVIFEPFMATDLQDEQGRFLPFALNPLNATERAVQWTQSVTADNNAPVTLTKWARQLENLVTTATSRVAEDAAVMSALAWAAQEAGETHPDEAMLHSCTAVNRLGSGAQELAHSEYTLIDLITKLTENGADVNATGWHRFKDLLLSTDHCEETQVTVSLVQALVGLTALIGTMWLSSNCWTTVAKEKKKEPSETPATATQIRPDAALRNFGVGEAFIANDPHAAPAGQFVPFEVQADVARRLRLGGYNDADYTQITLGRHAADERGPPEPEELRRMTQRADEGGLYEEELESWPTWLSKGLYAFFSRIKNLPSGAQSCIEEMVTAIDPRCRASSFRSWFAFLLLVWVVIYLQTLKAETELVGELERADAKERGETVTQLRIVAKMSLRMYLGTAMDMATAALGTAAAVAPASFGFGARECHNREVCVKTVEMVMQNKQYYGTLIDGMKTLFEEEAKRTNHTVFTQTKSKTILEAICRVSLSVSPDPGFVGQVPMTTVHSMTEAMGREQIRKFETTGPKAGKLVAKLRGALAGETREEAVRDMTEMFNNKQRLAVKNGEQASALMISPNDGWYHHPDVADSPAPVPGNEPTFGDQAHKVWEYGKSLLGADKPPASDGAVAVAENEQAIPLVSERQNLVSSLVDAATLQATRGYVDSGNATDRATRRQRTIPDDDTEPDTPIKAFEWLTVEYANFHAVSAGYLIVSVITALASVGVNMSHTVTQRISDKFDELSTDSIEETLAKESGLSAKQVIELTKAGAIRMISSELGPNPKTAEVVEEIAALQLSMLFMVMLTCPLGNCDTLERDVHFPNPVYNILGREHRGYKNLFEILAKKIDPYKIPRGQRAAAEQEDREEARAWGNQIATPAQWDQTGAALAVLTQEHIDNQMRPAHAERDSEIHIQYLKEKYWAVRNKNVPDATTNFKDRMVERWVAVTANWGSPVIMQKILPFVNTLAGTRDFEPGAGNDLWKTLGEKQRVLRMWEIQPDALWREKEGVRRQFFKHFLPGYIIEQNRSVAQEVRALTARGVTVEEAEARAQRQFPRPWQETLNAEGPAWIDASGIPDLFLADTLGGEMANFVLFMSKGWLFDGSITPLDTGSGGGRDVSPGPMRRERGGWKGWTEWLRGGTFNEREQALFQFYGSGGALIKQHSYTSSAVFLLCATATRKFSDQLKERMLNYMTVAQAATAVQGFDQFGVARISTTKWYKAIATILGLPDMVAVSEIDATMRAGTTFMDTERLFENSRKIHDVFRTKLDDQYTQVQMGTPALKQILMPTQLIMGGWDEVSNQPENIAASLILNTVDTLGNAFASIFKDVKYHDNWSVDNRKRVATAAVLLNGAMEYIATAKSSATRNTSGSLWRIKSLGNTAMAEMAEWMYTKGVGGLIPYDKDNPPLRFVHQSARFILSMITRALRYRACEQSKQSVLAMFLTIVRLANSPQGYSSVPSSLLSNSGDPSEQQNLLLASAASYESLQAQLFLALRLTFSCLALRVAARYAQHVKVFDIDNTKEHAALKVMAMSTINKMTAYGAFAFPAVIGVAYNLNRMSPYWITTIGYVSDSLPPALQFATTGLPMALQGAQGAASVTSDFFTGLAPGPFKHDNMWYPRTVGEDELGELDVSEAFRWSAYIMAATSGTLALTTTAAKTIGNTLQEGMANTAAGGFGSFIREGLTSATTKIRAGKPSVKDAGVYTSLMGSIVDNALQSGMFTDRMMNMDAHARGQSGCANRTQDTEVFQHAFTKEEVEIFREADVPPHTAGDKNDPESSIDVTIALRAAHPGWENACQNALRGLTNQLVREATTVRDLKAQLTGGDRSVGQLLGAAEEKVAATLMKVCTTIVLLHKKKQEKPEEREEIAREFLKRDGAELDLLARVLEGLRDHIDDKVAPNTPATNEVVPGRPEDTAPPLLQGDEPFLAQFMHRRLAETDGDFDSMFEAMSADLRRYFETVLPQRGM